MLVCAEGGESGTLQTPSSYCLVSLAMTDMAVGLCVRPFGIPTSLGVCAHFHSRLFLACLVLVLRQNSIHSLLPLRMLFPCS